MMWRRAGERMSKVRVERIRLGWATHDVHVKIATATKDLGVDTALGQTRTTTTRSQRATKHKKRIQRIAQMAKTNFRQRGLTDYEKYMVALARQRRMGMKKNENVIPFPKQD